MKKILGVFALFVVLNGCNDGDLKIDTINFDAVQANSCDETIYKLNGNEALFMKIPASLNAFNNDVTALDSPTEIPILGSVTVTYRAYNGLVTAANICNSPGPIAPIATEEWVATSGTIEISTIALYSTPDVITGATKITKYAHHIVFKNLVFSKPEGTQIYETFTFGDYNTTPTTLPLSFDADNVRICASNQLVYNARTNGIEGLFIQNFDATLLNTSNLGVAKTALLSSTSNKLVYRLFKSAFTIANNADYFCGATFPTTPEVNEEWIAKDGVTSVSGILEVTTTTNGSGFLHTIRLKAVTLQKGNSTFYLGDNILYGSLLTN